MKLERRKYVKHFTCWNKLLVMMFGQLSIQVAIDYSSPFQ
ncbi:MULTISPECIES: DUF4372 domain-containing protein [Prevotella]